MGNTESNDGVKTDIPVELLTLAFIRGPIDELILIHRDEMVDGEGKRRSIMEALSPKFVERILADEKVLGELKRDLLKGLSNVMC